MRHQIICRDCLDALKELDDNSIDLIATDPPYGLSFMGENWDKALPNIKIWKECLRVLKPGAFAFVMSIPRQDCLSRMIINLEDAGFETGFTSVYWAFSSGFPKAGNIGKMVDKRLGVEREVIGIDETVLKRNPKNLHKQDYGGYADGEISAMITKPATHQSKVLDGSYAGFQPKPALENIIRGQKPLDTNSVLTITTSQALILIGEVIQCIDVNIVKSSLLQNPILEEYIAQRNVMDSIIEEAKANIGRVANHYGLMDILKSILEEVGVKQGINLNIGLLWKSILVDLLGKVNRFTIEMATEQIIELKTLNSLLLQSIQESTIIQEKTQQNGVMLNVKIVESILESVLINLLSLNQTSVNTNVTLSSCMKNRSISVNGAKKSLERIIQKENIVPNNVTTKVVLVAMKPLSEKSYTKQALKNRKGIVWFKDCMIPFTNENDMKNSETGYTHTGHQAYGESDIYGDAFKRPCQDNDEQVHPSSRGRFSANLIVSDDILNDGKITCSGVSKTKHLAYAGTSNTGFLRGESNSLNQHNDSGSFSRYFDLDAWWQERVKKLPKEVQKTFPFLIVPKASKNEKNKGCSELEEILPDTNDFKNLPSHRSNTINTSSGKPRKVLPNKNNHPTVKPLTLMSYLITLGSRKNDVILDPFVGSGTVSLASKMLSRKSIGIETNPKYVKIAKARLKSVSSLDEWL